jgi:hypothetical protein
VVEIEELLEKNQKDIKNLEEIRNETPESPPAADLMKLFSLLGISELQLSAVLQSGDPPRTLLHEVEHNLRQKVNK